MGKLGKIFGKPSQTQNELKIKKIISVKYKVAVFQHAVFQGQEYSGLLVYVFWGCCCFFYMHLTGLPVHF